MKMLVEKIVIPLIFRRQLEMGIDPTYLYIYICLDLQKRTSLI